MDVYRHDRGLTMNVSEGELNGLPEFNPHFYNFSMILTAVLRRYIAPVTKALIRLADFSITLRTEAQ